MQRLVIDVGNSTTRFALMDDHLILISTALLHSVFDSGRTIPSIITRLLDTAEERVPAVISSVAPEYDAIIHRILQRDFAMACIDVDVNKVDWFDIAYDEPDTLGRDRLCDVIAAHELYGYPVIVVDFGTATTLNVLDRSGAFIGGSITPGIDLVLQALERGTSLLPLVKPASFPTVIGRSTEECIASGVVNGLRHNVAGMIDQITRQLGGDVHVIVTGGNAFRFPILVPPGAVLDQNLQLKGIVIFAQRNGA